jgi:acyl carrier protein
MTDAEILDGVRTVAERHLQWRGELRPETRLVEDLELDSITALTLAVEVENLFRVRLDPEIESRIVTVGDLVAAIRGGLDG